MRHGVFYGLGCALLLGIGLVPSAQAQVKLEGRWWTPLGIIKVSQKGLQVSGTLMQRCQGCAFKKGEEVLKGLLLDDSLSGQIRYCLKGKDCQGDGWAPLVLLVARQGKVLSGAAHFQKTECKIVGKGQGSGLIIRKVRPQPPKPPAPPVGSSDGGVDAGTSPGNTVGNTGTGPGLDGGVAVASAGNDPPQVENPDSQSLTDDKGRQVEPEVKPLDPKAYEANRASWRAAMEEGQGLMEGGFFERARRKFLEATELDPTRPEAFNGVGVTYYARQDYDEALSWYKKSLEVNPNFGDAFYNMACIYSLTKKKDLAFRYLDIAALNGFVQPQVLEEDPDLANLRSEPRYQEILRKMKTGSAGAK